MGATDHLYAMTTKLRGDHPSAPFVAFKAVQNPAQLDVGPILYERRQGQFLCFILCPSPLYLSLSLPFENVMVNKWPIPILTVKTQQDTIVYQNFIIPYFKWGSTCFGWHIAHHQKPKTTQAASGFAYVGGCRTCSCWTSGSVWDGAVCGRLHYLIRYLTTSNNCTSDNLPRMQNQRLLV